MLVKAAGERMYEDAFSKYHPAVNFLFFVGVVTLAVTIQHPVYLLAGVLESAVYYLFLYGRKGWKRIGGLIPLFLFLTIINPLINTRGVTILFRVFGRPYTLEALIFGIAIAAIFVVMMLWLGCYNKVLTSDKFTSLFGSVMPSVSLLLVMIFRMVPNLLQKAKQMSRARSLIGKGSEGQQGKKEKLTSGLTVLGAMTSCALEESVVTADSMRSRGYGSAKRSSYQIYHMTAADWILLLIMAALMSIVIGFAAGGSMGAEFVPVRKIAPVGGFNLVGFAAYCVFLAIPMILHIKEAIQWSISKSKI